MVVNKNIDQICTTQFKLHEDNSRQAIIRSPSGDTDIIVLTISLLYEFKRHATIDNGTGKQRKSIRIGGLELSEQRCHSLIGLHAFTGNDYFVIIFRKRERSVLEKQRKNIKNLRIVFTT